MIGRITGTLAEKSPPQLLIDVNGVGYEVDVPMSSFYNLPALGERTTLLNAGTVLSADWKPGVSDNWAGKQDAKTALDKAVSRGNELIEKFAKANKDG